MNYETLLEALREKRKEYLSAGIEDTWTRARGYGIDEAIMIVFDLVIAEATREA